MSTNLRTSSLELDWNQEFDRQRHKEHGKILGRCGSSDHSVSGLSSSGLVVVFPPLARIALNSAGPAEQTFSAQPNFYDFFKRTFDVLGAAILLVMLAPLMGLIVIAVRLNSRGPVIFTQRRLTFGGRIFTMYKFRTMKINAESDTGAVWASMADPRVTRVGRYLRMWRLDELPQLLNVLRGEMSLIGPRPERPEIATNLSKDLPSFNHRLAVKAGITGLAQTATGYASSVETYRKKLAWDILYVRRRCLLLDLRIALKTVVVVLTGSGSR